jgi:hypothetical protein
MMKPFTVPNLPTDNLYKFYAISGIVLILFTLTFETIILRDLEEKSNRIKELIKINELQTKYLYEDVLSLEKESEILKNELNEYSIEEDSTFDKSKALDKKLEKLKSNSGYRDYLEFYYKHQTELIPEFGKLKEIMELTDKHVAKKREYEIKSVEIESKKNELKDNLKNFKQFFYIGIYLAIQGIFLSISGFRKWKLKVQDKLDKKLELELKILENEERKNYLNGN